MKFQIDWSQKGGSESGAINIYCTCGYGTVIGLTPDSDYWINVEVFTSAGIGTPSEKYLASTFERRKLRSKRCDPIVKYIMHHLCKRIKNIECMHAVDKVV